MIARIVKKEIVVRETLLVEFDLAPQEVDFLPGQYFFITLKDPPFEDSRGNTRHFSIINSPLQKSRIVMTTKLRNSAFKKSLRRLPLGTEVEIGSIKGDFVLTKDNNDSLVFIAAGIGITPFMSMLNYFKDAGFDKNVTLIYSNRHQKSAAFLKDLQKLDQEQANFKLIVTMTHQVDWPGQTGRIDTNFIKKHIPEAVGKTFYVAGSPSAVEGIYNSLIKSGIEPAKIKTENFSGY